MTQRDRKLEQLAAAARTIKPGQARRRVALARMLAAVRRPRIDQRAALFYLPVGAVPASLWDND